VTLPKNKPALTHISRPRNPQSFAKVIAALNDLLEHVTIDFTAEGLKILQMDSRF